MSAPEFNNPSTVMKPVGAYSHAGLVKAGSDILYIAGQVGITADGTMLDGLAAQADAAFGNVLRILEANGMTAANLAKLNIYVVAGQDAAVTREARKKHLGEARPASTFVFISQLVDPKLLIEVEGVACR
ncbi:MAG TPA: RidA family protein [Rhizomicrobium sp.]|jgi:enamine deaminase RidA (YjgF/YER057c/UK114 family)|nr:RidA family protein [Rhizomicrobium sp.]